MLGLNPGKLPTNTEVLTFTKGDLKFTLLPSQPSKRYASRPHRLLIECPQCHDVMSTGRFNQHQGVHPREQLSQVTKDYLLIR
jgi:hypothetical protein